MSHLLIMNNDISVKKLFFDPRQRVVDKFAFPSNEPEMTEFESAFLCGLIREKKPKKIVEFGIAAGGTTAIMLECLSLLGMNETTSLFSIDCCELFYRGNGEKTGYLAEEYKKNTGWKGNHKVFLGKYYPQVWEEIGNDIDFVVLDTVHRLPGEFLDYLAVFPHLTPHACVVLHDINLNHIDGHESYATQLLMDTVVADKYLQKDASREYGFPNIGAFEINENSMKYISDVFHALNITWNYLPEKPVYELYLQLYAQNYNPEFVRYAEVAYELQSHTLLNKHNANAMPETWRLSSSYKIGRMITYLPRKIKSLLVRK